MSVGLDRVVLQPLTAADWPAVTRIYEAGIDGGNATFEARAPSWEEWSGKRGALPALVARDADGEVIGWAWLAPVSPRECYRGVGAVSIYVAPWQARRGVGRTLLQGLIAAAEQAGIWTIEAGIFPENKASVALHESCGFRLVGLREQVGQMPDGRWRDVALYERRSRVIGVDIAGDMRADGTQRL